MGAVNQHLCLDSQNRPTHNWCTYEAIDSNTFIIEISFMISLIILTVLVARYCKILFQSHRRITFRLLGRDTNLQVFALVSVWLICSIIKVIINLVIYQVYMKQDFSSAPSAFNQQEQLDRNSTQPIVIFSSVFLFLDFMCPYILLFLMLLIPYKWLKSALLNINQNKEINYQTRKKIQIIFKVLNVMKIYSKFVMIFFPLLLLIEPFLLYFTNIGCIMPRYNVYFMYTQSIIVLLMYIFGFVCFKLFKKYQLLRISSRHLSRIKKQYFLLLAILIIRMGLNYYFKLSKFYKYKPNYNCSDMESKATATIFMAVAQFIMHLLPIVIVVFVYRPNHIIDQPFQNNDIVISSTNDSYITRQLSDQNYRVNY